MEIRTQAQRKTWKLPNRENCKSARKKWKKGNIKIEIKEVRGSKKKVEAKKRNALPERAKKIERVREGEG